MHFGKWLTLFIQKHGISQRQLSKAAGIHANVIHGWRTGRTHPNGSSLIILSTALEKLTPHKRADILEMIAIEILKDI